MKPLILWMAFLPAGASAAGPLGVLRGHSDEASSVAFFPDGWRVLTAGDDGSIRVWDAETDALLSVWDGHEAEIGAAVLSADGRLVVSGGDDLTLRLWDAASGKETGRVAGHRAQTRRLALSPDGRLAATCSWDGHLALWDLKSRALVARLETRETSRVHDAAFSPDGKFLLAAQGDKTLKLWDVERREIAAEWGGHVSGVLTAAFSPDGRLAVSGSRDNTLRLWDAGTGRVLRVLRGHTSHVTKAVFSPDGKTVLSGGADFTVRLWRVSDGEALGVFWGHQGAVLDLDFSPDGRTAASAGEDHEVLLWDIAGGRTPRESARAPREVPPPPDMRPEHLGRLLFYEQRLSGDSSRDCAFCHAPEKAYADDRPLSLGYPDTLYFRNVPTLLDLPRSGPLGLDGRFDAAKLTEMLSAHIREPYFMNADPVLLVEKLRQAPGYAAAFERVFRRPPDFDAVLASLAAYLRTLTTIPSERKLSASAQRGRDLFNGKAGCASCHAGAALTDGSFHRRNTPKTPEVLTDPLRQASLLRYLKAAGVPGYAEAEDDPGRFAVTGREADRGAFRTPSLLHAADTPPYMRNGTVRSLEEAVRLENPGLSGTDIRDIAEYLRELSPAVANPAAPPELPAYRAMSPAPERAAALPPLPARDPRPLGPLPPKPAADPKKSELGKLLFFDHRLSGDGESQCASCHEPALGWGDGSDLAQGYERTLHWRNAPTLLNAAFQKTFHWDGSAAFLEDAIRASLASNVEMHGDPGMIEERLAQSPEYVKKFRDAFGVRRPDFASVVAALAAFLRDVPVTGDSPFDRHIQGDGDALGAQAKRGLELFRGKAGCIRCHDGAMLSDGGYHALPLPRNPAFDHVALRQITLRYVQLKRGRPSREVLREGGDPGRSLATGRPEDRGKFRTPSLRELAHTAPYMHNGVLATLADVISFYDGAFSLRLTEEEKLDLEKFLEALSGPGVEIEQPEKPGRRLSTSEYWR